VRPRRARRQRTIRVRGIVPLPLAPLRDFVARAPAVPAIAPFPLPRPAAVEIDAAGDVVAWLEFGRGLGGVRLAWRFEQLRVATGVELAACFSNASLPIRLLFLLGGRARIERRLEAALTELTEIARIAGAGSSLGSTAGESRSITERFHGKAPRATW
jgi:hypothetical protein